MSSVHDPKRGGARGERVHGAWLLAGWVAACVAAGSMLLSLSMARPDSYPGAVEFAWVFGYVVLTTLAGITTVAALSRFWTNGD